MANRGTWGISLRRYRQFFRRVANEVESFVKIWFQNYGRREEMLTACFIKRRRRRERKAGSVRRCRIISNENPARVSIFRLFRIQMENRRVSREDVQIFLDVFPARYTTIR